jgi:hypothetical protein
MIVSNHERARYYMHVGRDHLDADEQTILEKHLDACPECRAYAVELGALQTRLMRAMRARWLGPHPRPALEHAIQARLARLTRLRRFLRSFESLAAAAGLIAAAAVLGWLLVVTGPFHAEPSATASLPGAVADPSTPAAPPGPALEAPTTVQHVIGMVFTAHDKLIGFDLDRERASPGETFTVTLHWEQSPGAFASKLNIGVYLLDADGNSVAHSNSVAFPYAASQPGSRRGAAIDRIAVPFALALPDALPVGTYRLIAKSYHTDVGLYPGSYEGEISVLLARLWIE